MKGEKISPFNDYFMKRGKRNWRIHLWLADFKCWAMSHMERARGRERDVAMFWVKWLPADPNTSTQLRALQPHRNPILTAVPSSLLPYTDPQSYPDVPLTMFCAMCLACRHSNPQMTPGNNIFPCYGRRKTLSPLYIPFWYKGEISFISPFTLSIWTREINHTYCRAQNTERQLQSYQQQIFSNSNRIATT